MVLFERFIALTIFLSVLQGCMCSPIASDAIADEKDVTKIFTADELQRARSAGVKDRDLITGRSRGVSVDEMIKLYILQKSEPVRYDNDNDTDIPPITFEEMTKICEIFAPEHKITNYSSTQEVRLNELWTALDDFPSEIQFLFMRNSLCAYGSQPTQLDKSADTFGSNFVPFMRFRFWILKSKNSTSDVERISAVRQVCCAYNGQYNKDITEMKDEPTTVTLSKEQITSYDKLWNDYETANTSQSFEIEVLTCLFWVVINWIIRGLFGDYLVIICGPTSIASTYKFSEFLFNDKVCNFLRTTNPTDKC